MARPVLKWAGGKRQLVGAILPLLPPRIGTYYEPFAGGAAVFFALAAQGRFKRAVLSDRNTELVDVYRALRTDVDQVIKKLKSFPLSEDAYYAIRASRPRLLAYKAARTLYLNKTGFNGLFRVNRAGEFNVPFGRYENPRVCNEENLRSAARLLAKIEILEEDFEKVCQRARSGDVVYLDPPYLPRSRTSHFAAYDRHPFGIEEHARLAKVFTELADRQVHAVLSNSDTPETRKLYAGFHPQFPKASRLINSKASARGPVTELLVSNGVWVGSR